MAEIENSETKISESAFQNDSMDLEHPYDYVPRVRKIALEILEAIKGKGLSYEEILQITQIMKEKAGRMSTL